MKPMRSFGLLCLSFYSLLLLNAHAQLNFLQKHEGSSTLRNVSSDKNDIITLSWTPVTFKLEPFDIRRASEISDQQALESILQMETVVLYKIKANPNSNTGDISSSNQVKKAITRNNNENIVLVWENTTPLNTIMLLDVLSDIQFDSKNSFSYTHKCYKKEINFISSGGITCVFVVKPKKVSMESFGRRLQEENITLAENETESDKNNSTSNVTTETPPKTPPPKYNSTVITANTTTSNPQKNNTTPKDTSTGTKNKPPIKTDVASVHPRSFFNSIVLLLAGGLVIGAIVVACIKFKHKWRKQKFLTLPNKKIDLQKLIIKPSFFSQPESGMVSVSSGVVLKPKRSLFLSETNNIMSPVIDVKTIQHLNLEENHRSSMIPEEVILTNIDDGPESLDSSKTSDASPQDIGFNIEFSMLDAQESSKFRGKNLKSEV